VSFDEGASWQSLQTNLPIVPVTDLVVKAGDLIAATQGRGIWILDDLSTLRQLTPERLAVPAYLFTPRPTLRVGGDRDENPGDAGTNPPAGVIFTYRLQEELPPESELGLEILTADDRRVRRFTRATEQGGESGDEDDEDSPAEDPRQLAAGAGFHRFAWNLCWPAPDRFEGQVLWNDLRRGPRVAPGRYVARMTAGEWCQAVDFEVLPDPRSAASLEELRAQEAFLLEVVQLLSRVHTTIDDLRQVRADVERVAARIEDEHAELAAELTAFAADLTVLEEALHQTKNESRQDPLNYPMRLNDKLGGLYQHAAGGDAAPTSSALELRATLAGVVEDRIADHRLLIDEHLPALEARLSAAGIGPLLR
jgi:hypothetical protein